MDETIIREQLLALLEGKNAHVTFEGSIAKFPLEHINAKAPGIPYSAWELIEHMRIAQYDVLDFIRNPNYQEMKWPDDYWPKKDAQASEKEWQKSIQQFADDLEALKAIVRNPGTDFTGQLPHAPKYNILREILLVADHNSYHTGQIVTLRRALGIY
jgi:uncharacterized damage-inducible protein DinB